jgi:hypothetical protein
MNWSRAASVRSTSTQARNEQPAPHDADEERIKEQEMERAKKRLQMSGLTKVATDDAAGSPGACDYN